MHTEKQMKTLSLLVVITAAATFVAGSAFAAPSAQRSAASIECSNEADSQGLHGKKRKEFRSKCKYGMKHQGGRQDNSWNSQDRATQGNRQDSWNSQGRDTQGSWSRQDSWNPQGRETQGSRPSDRSN